VIFTSPSKQRSKLEVQRGELVSEEDRLDMGDEIILKRKDEIEKSAATIKKEFLKGKIRIKTKAFKD